MIRYLILLGLVVLVFPVAYAKAGGECSGLRITEIRPNAIGRDTGPLCTSHTTSCAIEGEWFELRNAANAPCIIQGSTLGFDRDAWKFVEDNGGHLLPNEDITIVMESQETIIMAAYPDRFSLLYPEVDAVVYDITNNPMLRNGIAGDFLEIRNSANQGSKLIDSVEWAFATTSEFSLHILSGGTIVQRRPSPGGCRVVIPAIGEFVETDIDLKPGSDPNSINLLRKGVVQVAILGEATFDVTEVDVGTLCFGIEESVGASPTHIDGHLEDVNLDGFTDLATHYSIQEAAFICEDTEATLTGALFDGQRIAGGDSVNIVGCK